MLELEGFHLFTRQVKSPLRVNSGASCCTILALSPQGPASYVTTLWTEQSKETPHSGSPKPWLSNRYLYFSQFRCSSLFKDHPCVKPMLPSTWQIYNLHQVTKGSELENQLKAKFSLKTEDFVDPLSTDTKTNQGSL